MLQLNNLISEYLLIGYVQRPVPSAEGEIKIKRRLFLLPGKPSLITLLMGEMQLTLRHLMTYGVSSICSIASNFNLSCLEVGAVVQLGRCWGLEKNHWVSLFLYIYLYVLISSLHLLEVYSIRLRPLFRFGADKIFFYFFFWFILMGFGGILTHLHFCYLLPLIDFYSFPTLMVLIFCYTYYTPRLFTL